MVWRLFVSIIAIVSLEADAEPRSLGAGSQPRIVTDGNDHVAIVFGRAGEIVISDSIDGGSTFSPPRIVDRVKSMPLGMRRGPRATLTDKTMVITAIESENGRGGDDNVRTWVSKDKGKTWTKNAKPLNSVDGSAREGLHGLASNRAGTVVCVWLDLRNTPKDRSGTEVWMNVSTDGGINWQGDCVVYRHAGGSVCECCHPSVGIDDANNIHVMFRHAKDGARDMYLTSSNDRGKTFDEPKKLGRGTWPLKACPMDGGDLIVDREGNIQSAWMLNGFVFAAIPGAAETELGKGRHPVIVAGSTGLWAGWSAGNALMSQFPKARATRLTDEGRFPVAIALKDGAVGITWESKQEVFFDSLRPPSP